MSYRAGMGRRHLLRHGTCVLPLVLMVKSAGRASEETPVAPATRKLVCRRVERVGFGEVFKNMYIQSLYEQFQMYTKKFIANPTVSISQMIKMTVTQ